MATKTASETPGRLPVLIVGAGSCGLAIAHGLRQADIPAIVFERDVDMRRRVDDRDWAIALHWAGPILARLIGEERWSRIQEASVDPNMSVQDVRDQPPVKILHGVTSEKLGEMVTGGEPFYRLLRSRLVTLLADGVDVRYSKSLESFTCHDAASVTARFTDGTEVEGSIIIGADGARSRVRSLLLGEQQAALSRLPFAATFFVASFTADQARALRAAQQHPLGCAMLHPKGSINMLSILDAADADRPETWRFTFYASTKRTVEEQDAEEATPLRERVLAAKKMVKDDGFEDPIRTAFELIPDDIQTAYYTRVANWDPSVPGHEWDNHGGLVTLVGDAAHPTTHHRGQGLNLAIEDAGKIVDLLTNQGSRPLKDIVDEFETEMIERGGKEVRLGELNSRMVHDWEAIMKSPLITAGVKAK